MKIKKGDIIIAAVVIVAAAAMLCWFYLTASSPETAVVTIDGETVLTVHLPYYGEYEPEGLEYPCKIVFDGDSVYIKDSTCPGHDCERAGTISRAGETIVCLPNKLAIRLAGKGYDAVIG